MRNKEFAANCSVTLLQVTILLVFVVVVFFYTKLLFKVGLDKGGILMKRNRCCFTVPAGYKSDSNKID